MSECSVFCLSALSSTSPDLSCNRLAPEPPGEAGEESLNPSAQIYSTVLSLSVPYSAVGTVLRNWLSLPGMGSSFHEKKDSVIPFLGGWSPFLCLSGWGATTLCSLLPALSFHISQS